ncbi:uncharacterized protein LOC129263227 [Lytechinus pictus]|uniref:uncharacterized protein LOC129263227 n=1 Tax=Lytechinus pictus TaxID=7653 RepID=UPI0030BA089C
MAFGLLALAVLASFVVPDPAHGFGVPEWTCQSCDCLPPQNLTTLDLSSSTYMLQNRFYVDEFGQQQLCYCLCGGKLGDKCTIRGDCIEGLFCADRPTKDSPFGVCEDRCEKDPTFKCKLYETCVVTKDGTPKCESLVRYCADNYDFPVCATNGNEFKTFRIRCELALKNKELDKLMQPRFQHVTIGTCPGDLNQAVPAPIPLY